MREIIKARPILHGTYEWGVMVLARITLDCGHQTTCKAFKRWEELPDSLNVREAGEHICDSLVREDEKPRHLRNLACPTCFKVHENLDSGGLPPERKSQRGGQVTALGITDAIAWANGHRLDGPTLAQINLILRWFPHMLKV